MRRTMLITTLAAMFAIGCQQDRSGYATNLQAAHEALQSGELSAAQERLRLAEEYAVENEISPTSDLLLMQAETQLALGHLGSAGEIAEDALASTEANAHDQARAQEVLGKIALRQGQFSEAQSRLSAAERGYESQEDRVRIADLIHLARGLASYGEGDIEVARRYWRDIQDPDLRHSMDQALADVSANASE